MRLIPVPTGNSNTMADTIILTPVNPRAYGEQAVRCRGAGHCKRLIPVPTGNSQG
ncbi:hypothetical protein D791_00024 [Nitrincola nitratireducens]|uniref:Uncharacterized protein n=1 Tax=Nitrincola nitratireducens TaxID=1229521 RepID=W9V017_9GAMM|nr:hypothetical protein D791_00024 [Nitrincola nitratireducens]